MITLRHGSDICDDIGSIPCNIVTLQKNANANEYSESEIVLLEDKHASKQSTCSTFVLVYTELIVPYLVSFP